MERATLTREASADTRSLKSGHGSADLTTRWQTEAADAGWTADLLDASVEDAATHIAQADRLRVAEVIDAMADQRSSWSRADVLQTVCDLQRPVSQLSGYGWAGALERAADRVVARLAAATAADRDALHHAEARAVHARRRTPPPNTDSTPPHAINGAAPATTSTSPTSNSSEPRTTSNGPANEPPRPSNATPTPSLTSTTRMTTFATATPSSSSTPCCPPSASSGFTPKP